MLGGCLVGSCDAFSDDMWGCDDGVLWKSGTYGLTHGTMVILFSAVKS